VRPNAGVEAWYRKKLDKAVTEMNNSVVYWLTANYRASGAMAMDATPATIMRSAMKKLASRWLSNFGRLADRLAGQFSETVMKNSDGALLKSLDDAGFTVEFRMTAPMRNALQATIGENVGLIRSIPERYLRDVEGLVMRSVKKGRALGELTEEIEQRYALTRRRAARIARDQNNKATTAMQAARQQSIGITKGIWRHSHAGKTWRPSHVKADGQEFELSKGIFLDGKWVMPGEEIECKCTWSPVIPGIN